MRLIHSGPMLRLIRRAAIALAVPGAVATAQRSFEIHTGIGFTVVDVQAASGQSGRIRSEETTLYRTFARFMFLPVGRTTSGVEAGLQHLYYYQVPVGAGSYSDRYVAPTYFAGVLKAPLGALKIEAGTGMYMYDEGSSVFAFGAAGVDLPLGSRLKVPLRLRTDFVMEDPSVTPFAASIGLAFPFGESATPARPSEPGAPSIPRPPHRSPLGAATLSVLAPGAGQIYNRESPGKTALHLLSGAAAAGLIATFVGPMCGDKTRPGSGGFDEVYSTSCWTGWAGLAASVGLRVWSGMDASASASRFNESSGRVSLSVQPDIRVLSRDARGSRAGIGIARLVF